MHATPTLALLALAITTAAALTHSGFYQQGGTTKLLGTPFDSSARTRDTTMWYAYTLNLLTSQFTQCQTVRVGVSGLTAAKRLSETPGVSLATVEAGSFYGSTTITSARSQPIIP